jgi:hypothetical protein
MSVWERQREGESERRGEWDNWKGIAITWFRLVISFNFHFYLMFSHIRAHEFEISSVGYWIQTRTHIHIHHLSPKKITGVYRSTERPSFPLPFFSDFQYWIPRQGVHEKKEKVAIKSPARLSLREFKVMYQKAARSTYYVNHQPWFGNVSSPRNCLRNIFWEEVLAFFFLKDDELISQGRYNSLTGYITDCEPIGP